MTPHITHHDDCGCKSQRYEKHIKRLRKSLEEVMSWIDNWYPDFTDDPEWKDTETDVNDALNALDADKPEANQ